MIVSNVLVPVLLMGMPGGIEWFIILVIVFLIYSFTQKKPKSKVDEIKNYENSNNELNDNKSSANQSNFNFCKNCGNSINSNAIVCLSCGCDPKRGNKHCNSCGVETNQEQIICIKCGVTLKNQTIASDEGKTVAVIAYLTLIGFIIALVQHSANKTRLGAYHLRQVVGFMVTSTCLAMFLWLFLLPSMFESGDFKYFSFVLLISWGFIFISLVMSFINALNGKEVPAPFFGKFYEKWFVNMFK